MSKSELRKKLSGIAVSLPTFNDENYNLQIEKTKLHVSWLLNNGISKDNSVLFIAGGLGEGYFLDDFEWESLANALVEAVDGRLSAGIGIFELSARKAAKKAAYASNLGMDFIQCAPPRYLQPTEDEIFGHYQYISDNADIGIMGYNTPWAMPTGYTFSQRLIERFLELENFVGLKWNTIPAQHHINMIRLFADNLSFISNGNVMSTGYRVGAIGFSDFIANVAPRLSLHRLKLIREKSFNEFDELELNMSIDPPLKSSDSGEAFDTGMGEGPGGRLILKSLGMNTGPHFPSQLILPEEAVRLQDRIVKASGILEWVDWNDNIFEQPN